MNITPLKPLQDLEVISLALNVPGPLAASHLQALGAQVIKIEPPGGDPLAIWSPAWYKILNAGQNVLRLDLKQPAGRERLNEMLSAADLLLTSTRPSAMERLGLAREQVSSRFPLLCQVAILGYAPPEEERAGHDLTYQAWWGLVDPPNMPRTLISDLAGAEQAAIAALALLLGHARGLGSGYAEVLLSEAAELFAQPLQLGATAPGGPFGGGLARYHLYRAKEGWLAVAAVEEHFWLRLNSELGLEADKSGEEVLQRIFLERTAEEWETWALERDLPLLAVRNP